MVGVRHSAAVVEGRQGALRPAAQLRHRAAVRDCWAQASSLHSLATQTVPVSRAVGLSIQASGLSLNNGFTNNL